MDDSVKEGSRATVGNVAIPDWMLKRRARMQALAAENNATPNGVEPTPAHVERFDRSLGAGDERVDMAAGAAEPEAVAAADSVPSGDSSLASPILLIDFDPLPVPVTLCPEVSTQSRSAAVPKNTVLPAVKAEKPELLAWHEVLRQRWLGKDALGSYAISIAMHVVAALLLSLVVFHEDLANMGINTLFAEQSDSLSGDALDDSAVFQIDTSGGQTGEELNSMLSANAISTALGPSALQAPEVAGAAIGEGDGAGSKVGDGLSLGGFQMPEGGKGVVKKGSFAAWTVPADPEPGEDYKIIIQVRYKSRSQKMPTGDISGSVVGTDKYRLMISPHTSEVIPEANQIVVHIPGAAARVRDTIRVYSAILRENQRLEIVF